MFLDNYPLLQTKHPVLILQIIRVLNALAAVGMTLVSL